MTYLLAKYTLIFLITAIVSFALGWWWSRRKFIDVSENYTDMGYFKAKDRQLWDSLWTRIEDLQDRMEVSLRAELQKILEVEFTEVEFQNLENKIDKLGDGLQALKEDVVQEFHTELQPLSDSGVSDEGKEEIENVIYKRLERIETQLHVLLDENRFDPSNMNRWEGKMEAQLKKMELFYTGLQQQLELKRSPSNVESRMSQRRISEHPLVRPSGLKLLDKADQGEKDNLKRILGIGVKLEKMLNDRGVFYFWQISSWGDADIAYIDMQLGAFKGRIKRDDWVSQARKFSGSGGVIEEEPSLEKE